MKRLLLALALLSSPAALLAQTATVPPLISYHGRVTDSAGVLVGTTPTNREVHFKIYNDKALSADANRLYSEKQTVTISNGEFSVLIGSGTKPAVTGQAALFATVDLAFNPTTGSGSIERYLGISVADANGAMGTEISPRQQIVTTAFALRAKVAEGLSGSITGSQIADGSITTAKIASGAIGTAQLSASAGITGSQLANLTIGSAQLAGSSVNYGKVAIDTITSATIVDGEVDTADLKDLAVTADKIKGLTITGAKIANNTIDATKLSFTPGGGTPDDGTVTYVKLAAVDVFSKIAVPMIIATADTLSADNVANQLIIRQSTGTQAKELLIGYDGATGSGSGVLQAVHNNIGYTPLQLNPAGGVVKTGSGGLEVAGATTLSSTLGVTGGTTLASLSATTGSFSSTLSVTGATTINGVTQINAALNVGGVASTFGTNFSPYRMSIKAASGEPGILSLRASNDTERISFLSDGTAYKTTSTWSIYSDRRLKHDIQPLSGALDRLLRLRSVTFQFNEPDKFLSGTVTGFIAQEVQEVFPEWVKPGPSGMLSLNINGFESSTVQALRELRAEKDAQLKQRDATIAALEKNVAAMKSESAETKARLATLERSLAALTARASN